MKTIKSLLVVIFAVFVSSFAYAQTKTVKGTVSADGNPLPGVAVYVSGTSVGTITDADGKYSVTVVEGEELVFDCLGYTKQTQKVGKSVIYDIEMSAESLEMEELVVVGYATQKKTNITGSVASVDYATLSESRPVTSTAAILRGSAAGLFVRQDSGKPGSEDVTLNIRGLGTLNSTSPLVIVDGFEGSIDNVNASDIESISVLKDAASCAIYGNRAANGVILVTTKTAKKGKFNIQYDGMVAYQTPSHHFDVISNYADYMEIMNEAATNFALSPVFSQAMIDLWREKEKDPYGLTEAGYPNYVAYPNTDWMDAMYESSIYQKHTISSTGTTEHVKYNVSVSYNDNPGVIQNSGSKRFSYRANVSSNVTDWLEIGAKFYGYRKDSETSSVDSSSDSVIKWWARAVPCIYPYYDGKYGWMENTEQNSNSRNNLYFLNRENQGEIIKQYANATAFLNITIPLGFKFRAAFNYTTGETQTHKYGQLLNAYSFSRNKVAYTYQDLSKLSVTQSQSHDYRWTFQTDLSWNRTIAGKHEISALLGYEMFDCNASSFSASKSNPSSNYLHELVNAVEMKSITGTQSDYSSISSYGRATYAYDGRYFAEFDMRVDGSSRFSPQTRWGFFPSVSGGWRISKEPFMEGSRIDNLKLRASWGRLGNNSIGNYEWQSTYDTTYKYAFGNSLSAGSVSTLSNELLTWETTTTTDVGLDFGIFNNRLTLETDWYNKYTDGILYRAPIIGAIGDKSAPLQNLCAVTNYGIEVTLGWKDQIGNFHYGVSGNFTRNWNQVSKYKGLLDAGWVTDENGIRTYKSNIGDVSTSADGVYRTIEGRMISEYYLLNIYSGDGSHFFADGSVNPNGGPTDGMIRTTEDMEWLQAMINAGNEFLPGRTVGKTGIYYGDYIYQDINGDGVYGGSDDYTFQNVSLTPKFYYGFSLNLGYKGLDFSATFSGAGGACKYWRYVGLNSYSLSSDMTIRKDIAYDHYFYDPENPDDPRTNLTSKNGRLVMAGSASGCSQSEAASTLWLYKTDYLKIDNVTIGYTFPKKWTRKIKMESARIFFTGENLYTFTTFPGMDPAYTATNNYYPQLLQITGGISIKF